MRCSGCRGRRSSTRCRSAADNPSALFVRGAVFRRFFDAPTARYPRFQGRYPYPVAIGGRLRHQRRGCDNPDLWKAKRSWTRAFRFRRAVWRQRITPSFGRGRCAMSKALRAQKPPTCTASRLSPPGSVRHDQLGHPLAAADGGRGHRPGGLRLRDDEAAEHLACPRRVVDRQNEPAGDPLELGG